MNSTEKFQVPAEFQSSFTQIPLHRKVISKTQITVKGKTFLPSLKALVNTLPKNHRSGSIDPKGKQNQSPDYFLKGSFIIEPKFLNMTSSPNIHRSSEQFLSRNSQPNLKVLRYKEFLKGINHLNGISVNLDIQVPRKYTYFVGKGNNHCLVQSLFKSRFWWVEGTSADSPTFLWTQIKKPTYFDLQAPFVNEGGDLKSVAPSNVHNHLPGNGSLGNKKSLYQNLKKYCGENNINLFDLVPLTYHIGAELNEFVEEFNRRQALKQKGESINNIWIIKPGENSNRGRDIVVIQTLNEFNQIQEKKSKGQTIIAQLYISRPFLYQKRKFDIRHYMMITSTNGIKGYWYKDGYIRTSSEVFQTGNIKNTQIHLTNDAIQKYSEKYGKYQQGNKLSYKNFESYLEMSYPEKKYDFSGVLMKMKQIATHAIRATAQLLDSEKKMFNFEIFGLDFMLDENLQPWLIEINTNPCLQVSSRVLNGVIPSMLENSFRLALDPLFPPPNKYPNSHRHNIPEVSTIQKLKYQLVYSDTKAGSKPV